MAATSDEEKKEHFSDTEQERETGSSSASKEKDVEDGVTAKSVVSAILRSGLSLEQKEERLNGLVNLLTDRIGELEADAQQSNVLLGATQDLYQSGIAQLETQFKQNLADLRSHHKTQLAAVRREYESMIAEMHRLYAKAGISGSTAQMPATVKKALESIPEMAVSCETEAMESMDDSAIVAIEDTELRQREKESGRKVPHKSERESVGAIHSSAKDGSIEEKEEGEAIIKPLAYCRDADARKHSAIDAESHVSTDKMKSAALDDTKEQTEDGTGNRGIEDPPVDSSVFGTASSILSALFQ